VSEENKQDGEGRNSRDPVSRVRASPDSEPRRHDDGSTRGQYWRYVAEMTPDRHDGDESSRETQPKSDLITLRRQRVGSRVIRVVEHHAALFTALTSSAPYLYLVGYLWIGLHGTQQEATMPGKGTFLCLAILGVALPCVGVTISVRQIVQELDRFQIRRIVETFVSLVVLFASGYALLQASSLESAISGMTQIWETAPTDANEHQRRLLKVYLESMYMSTVTITTVGYGDMVPRSGAARLLAALEGVAGIGFIGLGLGYYFSSAPRAPLRDES